MTWPSRSTRPAAGGPRPPRSEAADGDFRGPAGSIVRLEAASRPMTTRPGPVGPSTNVADDLRTAPRTTEGARAIRPVSVSTPPSADAVGRGARPMVVAPQHEGESLHPGLGPHRHRAYLGGRRTRRANTVGADPATDNHPRPATGHPNRRARARRGEWLGVPVHPSIRHRTAVVVGLLDLSLVTSALVELLKAHIGQSSAWAPGLGTPLVTAQPPDQLEPKTLGVYLYHVVEDPHLKNQPPAGPDNPPVRFNPMGLQLHYQLSALGEGDAGLATLQEQLLIGAAMKALHDYPVIDDNAGPAPCSTATPRPARERGPGRRRQQAAHLGAARRLSRGQLVLERVVARTTARRLLRGLRRAARSGETGVRVGPGPVVRRPQLGRGAPLAWTAARAPSSSSCRACPRNRCSRGRPRFRSEARWPSPGSTCSVTRPTWWCSTSAGPAASMSIPAGA